MGSGGADIHTGSGRSHYPLKPASGDILPPRKVLCPKCSVTSPNSATYWDLGFKHTSLWTATSQANRRGRHNVSLPFTLFYYVSSSKCKSTNELLRFGENRQWSVFPAQDFPKCILCTSDLTDSLELSNKSHLNLSLSFCIGNLIYMFHMSIFLSPRGHRTYIPCETQQNVYSTTGKKRPSKIMQTHFYSVGEYDFKLCEFCLCCICLSL